MGTITEAMKDAINSSSLIKKNVYVDGIHEYDYLKDDLSSEIAIHTLYHSNSNVWHQNTKGTMAVQLLDDGDGVQINNVDINNIEYLELEQLHILLRLHAQLSKYEILDPLDKKEF